MSRLASIKFVPLFTLALMWFTSIGRAQHPGPSTHPGQETTSLASHGVASSHGAVSSQSVAVSSIDPQASIEIASRPERDVTQFGGGSVLRDDFPAFDDSSTEDEQDADAAGSVLVGPAVTTVSALMVVLAVFGGLVWVSRRFGSPATPAGVLPSDVYQRLGSAQLDAKTRVTFVKIGSRILVIGQSPSGGPQTLSEIDDPDEVERLTGRCLGRPEIIGRRGTRPKTPLAMRRDLAVG